MKMYPKFVGFFHTGKPKLELHHAFSRKFSTSYVPLYIQ